MRDRGRERGILELIRKEEGSDRRNKVKRRGTRRETKRKRLWRDETKGGVISLRHPPQRY